MGEKEDIMLNLLADMGTEYSKLLPFPVKEYKKLRAINRIPVGNTDPDLMGEDIFIDMSTACRIAFIARTRGGKSYFLTQIASYCYQSGYMLAITNDNKNEWAFAREPTPVRFRDRVHPNYEIKPIPVTLLMPKFLWDLKVHNKNSFIPIQFDMNQITQKDLITVMGFKSIFTKEQFVNAIKLLWSHYEKKGIDKMNFQDFYDDINDIEKFKSLTRGMFGKATRKSLMSRLIPIKTTHVFGSKNAIDLKELLLDNKVPSMCIEGSDKVDIEIVYTYLAIMQRLMRIYKIENPVLKSRRLILINDETSFIAPNDGFSSAKFECLENNQRGAYYGIYQLFGIQDTDKVDMSIISQCKYVFISSATSGVDIRRVCKILNVPEETRYYIMENIHKLSPRQDGQRGWFMLETGMEGHPLIVYPYAPACGFSSKTFK